MHICLFFASLSVKLQVNFPHWSLCTWSPNQARKMLLISFFKFLLMTCIFCDAYKEWNSFITARVSWDSRHHWGITLKNAYLNNLMHIVGQYLYDYIACVQIVSSIYLLYPGLFWWRKTNIVILMDKKGRRQRKPGRRAMKWRKPDNFIDLEWTKHYDPGKSFIWSYREIV